MNVSLSSELRDFVLRKVESGQFPSVEAVLQEAVRRFRLEDESGCGTEEQPAPVDPVDHEAVTYCARQVEGEDVPSIEELRQSLAKIRGSMAQAVIEERQDRP
jgi:Arc/MetJ-type ribon-helix-helix transcriptional regulator